MRTNTQKVCKVCSRQFQAWSTEQRINRFCSPACAATFGQKKRDAERLKLDRKDIARRKESLKTLGEWTKEAQAAVNAFVRERDYGKPCISCGTMSESSALTGSSWDAGHYRSRGSAPHLRFRLDNIFKQCSRCNRELSGNTVEMRKGVALRIGIDRLESLESDNRSRQYKVSDLKRIKSLFNRRARNYRKWRSA